MKKTNFIDRAFDVVNVKHFKNICPPDEVFDYELKCPFHRQYILRMMIKEPHQEFKIPEELEWCREMVEKCNNIQIENNIRHSYCYISVRHGKVDTKTDSEWHTDGYSEVLTHIPEQNYIITSNEPTEYVEMPIDFPEDFDALKHNIVSFINKEIEKKNPEIKKAKENTMYVFDPYVIHRRPLSAKNKKRTFVRITFVPIEICDDACFDNPLMEKRIYNRNANTTRNKLTNY